MAEKKATKLREDMAPVPEAEEVLQVQPKSDDMVPVFIPKESKHDDSCFVAVNGERILVKKGQQVMVPRRFAEVIENSHAMALEAQKYIEMMTTE